MEAAVIVIGVVSVLTVVTLRQDLAGTAGADGLARHHRPVARRGPRLDFLLGPGCIEAS